MHNHAPGTEARAAERASDIEQQHGRAGNSRDAREADEPGHPEPQQVLGGSGHVVPHEVAEAMVGPDATGSPGADADRNAAERKG